MRRGTFGVFDCFQLAASAVSADAVSAEAGYQTLASRREWAPSVAAGSQRALHSGLAATVDNLTYVPGILVFGIAYALSRGLVMFRRQWRRQRPLDLSMRQHAAGAVPTSLV